MKQNLKRPRTQSRTRRPADLSHHTGSRTTPKVQGGPSHAQEDGGMISEIVLMIQFLRAGLDEASAGRRHKLRRLKVRYELFKFTRSGKGPKE